MRHQPRDQLRDPESLAGIACFPQVLHCDHTGGDLGFLLYDFPLYAMLGDYGASLRYFRVILCLRNPLGWPLPHTALDRAIANIENLQLTCASEDSCPAQP